MNINLCRKEGEIMEEYIYCGTQKLRCGYTTGSCAAAAAKAAAELLLTGKKVSEMEITLPQDKQLIIPIKESRLNGTSAVCSVVKDSGDDPDITNNTVINAEVFLTDNGTEITGGEGVGIVTKPGLDQPVGEYAINSGPRKIIALALSEVAELYEYKGGFRVVITVPEGRKIAEKTYNPHMGIVDGISILGTTGIVEPMSTRALIETIRTEINMRRAEKRNVLLLTLGNYSEKFRQESLAIPEGINVSCSNYIGEAIDIGITAEFKNILIIGHIGKMVKLGAGIMNTHSHEADGRMETLITCGVMADVPNKILRQLNDCVTVDAAIDILEENNCAKQVLDILVQRIEKNLTKRAGKDIKTGAVIFSFQNDILLKTSAADELICRIKEEKV